MAQATPNYSDIAILTPQTLARGSYIRATIDLRAKWGAFLFLLLGRGGNTAISAPVDVLVRALGDDNSNPHPVGIARVSGTTAASTATVTSDSSSDQLNVDTITGFAAGDIVSVQEPSGSTFARFELHRVRKTATGIIHLDRPLRYTHTGAQGDKVRNKADAWQRIALAGGTVWEVVFDYTGQSTGESITIHATARQFNHVAS